MPALIGVGLLLPRGMEVLGRFFARFHVSTARGIPRTGSCSAWCCGRPAYPAPARSSQPLLWRVSLDESVLTRWCWGRLIASSKGCAWSFWQHPAHTARGWGATGRQVGALYEGRGLVQYGQPLVSTPPPSCSSRPEGVPAVGSSLGHVSRPRRPTLPALGARYREAVPGLRPRMGRLTRGAARGSGW